MNTKVHTEFTYWTTESESLFLKLLKYFCISYQIV